MEQSVCSKFEFIDNVVDRSVRFHMEVSDLMARWMKLKLERINCFVNLEIVIHFPL